jgi:ketosteroid isomerase-like protein
VPTDPGQTASGFAQALLGGNAAVAAAYFAPEARLMTADGTEVSGSHAIRQVLGQLIGSEVELEIRLGRTLLAGPVALSTQYWRLTGTSGAESFERSSTARLVLQRQGGSWLILIASPWG